MVKAWSLDVAWPEEALKVTAGCCQIQTIETVLVLLIHTVITQKKSVLAGLQTLDVIPQWLEHPLAIYCRPPLTKPYWSGAKMEQLSVGPQIRKVHSVPLTKQVRNLKLLVE